MPDCFKDKYKQKPSVRKGTGGKLLDATEPWKDSSEFGMWNEAENRTERQTCEGLLIPSLHCTWV